LIVNVCAEICLRSCFILFRRQFCFYLRGTSAGCLLRTCFSQFCFARLVDYKRPLPVAARLKHVPRAELNGALPQMRAAQAPCSGSIVSFL
jgi:hypothetical protein